MENGDGKPGERTQRCSSITAIIIITILVSFSTSELPPDAMTGARRTATATVKGNKSVRGERGRD